MPIDPAGTTPGLQQPLVEEPPKLNLKCRNPSCDSILAIEIKFPGQLDGRRMYQCVKCKTSRSIPVGGSVDI